jgi:hypothetical protein
MIASYWLGGIFGDGISIAASAMIATNLAVYSVAVYLVPSNIPPITARCNEID